MKTRPMTAIGRARGKYSRSCLNGITRLTRPHTHRIFFAMQQLCDLCDIGHIGGCARGAIL